MEKKGASGLPLVSARLKRGGAVFHTNEWGGGEETTKAPPGEAPLFFIIFCVEFQVLQSSELVDRTLLVFFTRSQLRTWEVVVVR